MSVGVGPVRFYGGGGGKRPMTLAKALAWSLLGGPILTYVGINGIVAYPTDPVMWTLGLVLVAIGLALLGIPVASMAHRRAER